MTVVLSLLSALCAGTSDFIGGLGSRRSAALVIATSSHTIGVVVAVVFGLFAGGDPTGTDLAWGAVGGVGGAGGLLSIYAGFARGQVSIVAPLAGVGAAAIPVLYDTATGSSLSGGAIAGIGVGLIAIALISLQAGGLPGSVSRSLLHGLGGAVGLGFMFVCFGQASDDGGVWLIVPARAVGAALLVAVMVVLRTPPRLTTVAAFAAIGVGVVSTAANALFIAAIHRGSLATAAVLTAMFPAATVLWARLVFREHLRPVQLAGLALALVSVGLIAGG